MIFKSYFKSPLGKLTILSTEEKITHLQFTDLFNLKTLKIKEIVDDETEVIKNLKANLKLYFSGIPVDFSKTPIELTCSEFQRKVYSILINQPYGTVTTYGELALNYLKKYNLPRMSAQAIGGAMKRNPILLVIPCHRVLKKDHSIGGFGAGSEIKQQLLEIENAWEPKSKRNEY